MITTQQDARRILAAQYPGLKIRFTIQAHLGVRPVYETDAGLPMLAWRKLARGKNSAVRIGVLLPEGGINWEWEG